MASFWTGLGRPRTLKIELPLKRELNFHFGPDTQKVRFWAPFWAPFWRLLGTLGAQVGHFGRQNPEKRGSPKRSEKKKTVFGSPGNPGKLSKGGAGPFKTREMRQL